MSALDAARLYIGRGWCPIPIPHGEKAPRVDGWPDLRIGLAEAERYFIGDCNIGLILGPPSGEIVDADLDCIEAVELADRYLPPTGAIFGRIGKPRSHWLYVSPGAGHETFVDPLDGSSLVELRAGRHQTVVPPSVHPSGERVEWSGAIIAPSVIPATVLRASITWLAMGALVRRHVSAYASERPGPDLPDLLQEADPKLGEAVKGWLRLPSRDARTAILRPRQQMSADDIDLAEIVHAIPNDGGWEDWNRMGLRIYAATGGSDHGAVIFDNWSAKSTKYNPYNTSDRWRHFHRHPPSRTGIGKLLKLAIEHGWRSPTGGRHVG